LVSGSIALNFVQVTTASVSGGYYVVPLGDLSPGASGVLTYELELSPSFNANTLNPSILVDYTLSAVQQQEIIGTANIEVNQVTINAPSTLATLNTVVSGQGPPGSFVTVYDNYTVLGLVTVPAGGFWQLSVTLLNGTSHVLHAQALTSSNVTLNSNPLNVVYDPSQSQLIQVSMQMSDGTRVSFNPQDGMAQFPYMISYGPTLTFELTFTDSSKVSNVYVFVEGAGFANATLGSDGVFRARVALSWDWGRWYAGLGSIFVGYTVLPFATGNGSLPANPSIDQIFADSPPEFSNATYTLISNSTTHFAGNVTLSNGLVISDDVQITPDVNYTPTASDIEEVNTNGYPVYGFNVSFANSSTEVGYNSTLFVPYSALPPSLVTQLDPPLPVAGQALNGLLLTGNYAINDVNYGKILSVESSINSAFTTWADFNDARSLQLQFDSVHDAIQHQFDCVVGYGTVGQGNALINLEDQLNQLESQAQNYEVFRLLTDIASIPFTWGPSLIFGAITGGFTAKLNGIAQKLASIQQQLIQITGHVCSHATASPHWVYDPSGYVYEGISSNRLANVTASIFYQDPQTGQWVPWDASAYGQQNQEQTDALGRYGWDVPRGTYMVVFQKLGFATAQSMNVNIPPPATGININLMSLTPPAVTGLSALANSGGSSVSIEFSKYMKASLLTQNTISVSMLNGQVLTGIVVPVNPQLDPNGVFLTRETLFTPASPFAAGSSYTVYVSHLVEDYANVTMTSDYVANVTAQTGVGYAVTTSSSAIQLGGVIAGNATTNDPLSTSVQFTWYAPGNQPVSKQSIPTSSGTAQSPLFYPDEVGAWSLQANFTDGNTVFQSESASFVVDVTPPTTALTIGSPKYTDIGGNTYVTSATSFTLSATDEPGGSGVASTAYKTRNATYDSGWIPYTTLFHLTGLNNGVYSIDYNSTDNAGNIEPTTTATVILDNAPPTTSLTIGDPKIVYAGNTYVNSSTPFTLTATDNAGGSGIAITAYRIYNATYDSGWTTYAGTFNLPNALEKGGTYTIAYNSTDNVGNTEQTHTTIITIILHKAKVETNPTLVKITPGQTATFTINVTNLGNVPDTYNLTVTFTDFNGQFRAYPTIIQTSWTLLAKTSSTLDPAQWNTATFTITVPANWAGMEDATYNFTATAKCQADPTVNASALASLVVKASKRSMAEYVGLELQWLQNTINNSNIPAGTKTSLLGILTIDRLLVNQAIQWINQGNAKVANNMLDAARNTLQFFIYVVKAQAGKTIPQANAQTLIQKAQQIQQDIQKAENTP
jgi:uncharacterized repeat protein (TIGR01451 family)